MPSLLSRLLMPEWSLPYNCYEIGHTWTPSCDEAALDISSVVFKESLKLYTPLYVLNALMRKKYDRRVLTSLATNILRSSCFLGFTAFLMLTVFCHLRRFTGKFYYTLCAYLPVFVSSLFAIQIEKRARRGPLAMYCANIASETVYRMLVEREYFKPLPRGEVILFTFSIPVLLYLIRIHGYGRDPISQALKAILGPEEYAHYVCKDKTTRAEENSPKIDENFNKPLINRLRHRCRQWLRGVDSGLPRHSTCTHWPKSCAFNSVLYFARNLAIGWSAQVLLATLWKPRLFLTSPKQLFLRQLLNTKHLYFGLFLGSFSAVFKTINCLLRWTTNASHDWHSFVAAFCAAPTMLLSVHNINTTISLYLFWKSIEMLYLMAVRKGWLGCVDGTVILLYAISTAQLAYVTILEPRAMRPSYLKFIDRITGQKLSSFNRLALDVFGTGASKGYEHIVFPRLSAIHTTRQFKENVINWII